MPIRGLILFAFFVGSLPVCFVRPFYGVVLWTIIAFLNPQSSMFYWSAALAFPWALAVAIPTLGGFLVFTRGWMGRLLRDPSFFLMLILWIWFTATSVISIHTPLFAHHQQDTWQHWSYISKMLLMTVVILAMTDTFGRLRLLILTVASCFGLYVLKSFPFVIMTGGAFRLYGPAYSMVADNNDFGLALNMTLPLFFGLSQTESKPWLKRLFTFLTFATIPAIFFTYSRGALVGLVAMGAMMLFQMRQRLLLLPVIGAAVAIALLFAPEAWKDRMDPSKAVDASARERLNAWAFSRNLAAEFPLTGGGFATFTPELFSRYAPDGNDIRGPHSIYFQVLAEHGFPGLALYLGFVIYSYRAAAKVARQARRWGDRLIAAYANMFRFALVGFLASGAFLGRAYFDYFFLIAACIAILKRIAATSPSEATEEEPEESERLEWSESGGVLI